MSFDAHQLADALEFATVSYAESTESTNTDLLADADAGPCVSPLIKPLAKVV